jgi:hypothetical protein
MEIKMNDMIKKTLVWLIFLSQLVYSSAALGYKPNVHVTITKNAVLKSQNIKSRLEAVGLLSSNGDIEKEVLMGLYLSYWIQRGANWEDGIQIAWGEPQDIAFCHFYNPIADKGYMSTSGAEIGQSLIARSHDVTNEWSYEMAKKLYYAALIGDNSEIMDNHITRMRPGWVPHLLGPITDMTEEDRDQYFAWTLQALGHTLHLIQDASVPAHTRNDFHGFMDITNRCSSKMGPYLDEYIHRICIWRNVI